ncbi:MAG: hypothetical protein AVDCRST_MAG89-2749, partial [uncultured Gemmatimonadetes bacterium]
GAARAPLFAVAVAAFVAVAAAALGVGGGREEEGRGEQGGEEGAHGASVVVAVDGAGLLHSGGATRVPENAICASGCGVSIYPVAQPILLRVAVPRGGQRGVADDDGGGRL